MTTGNSTVVPTVRESNFNGTDIRVETYDVTPMNGFFKLDILFYNTINRYGKILSSMVFNSGVKDGHDTSPIIYNPNKLLLNSNFEKSYIISTPDSNIWKNNTIITSGASNLKDNSRGALYSYKDYTLGASSGSPSYSIPTDYAVEYINGDHSYDGWYSLCSVIIATDPATATPVPGSFRYYNGTDIQYYNGTDWVALNQIPDQTVPVYNFLNNQARGEKFVKYDFMVTTKIDSLYRQLLEEKFDKSWFKKVNSLSPKMDTLQAAIEFRRFDIAQHMINAVSNSLLSLLI